MALWLTNAVQRKGARMQKATDAFPTRIPQETTDDFVLPSERGGLPQKRKVRGRERALSPFKALQTKVA